MGKALIDIKRQKYILHPHFLSHTRYGNFGHSGRFKIESSFFWQLLALATMVPFLATVVLFLATVLLFGNFHV